MLYLYFSTLAEADSQEVCYDLHDSLFQLYIKILLQDLWLLTSFLLLIDLHIDEVNKKDFTSIKGILFQI